MANQVTDKTFELETAKGRVLVDMYADWCGPCKQLAPVIEELSKEYEGKVKIFKLNVDDNTEVPSKFGVSSIPVLVLLNDGKEVGRMVGFQTKDDIEDKFKELGWM